MCFQSNFARKENWSCCVLSQLWRHKECACPAWYLTRSPFGRKKTKLFIEILIFWLSQARYAGRLSIWKLLKTWLPHYKRDHVCQNIWYFEAQSGGSSSRFQCFRIVDFPCVLAFCLGRKVSKLAKNLLFWVILEDKIHEMSSLPWENHLPKCMKYVISWFHVGEMTNRHTFSVKRLRIECKYNFLDEIVRHKNVKRHSFHINKTSD